VRWYTGQEGEPAREGGDIVLRLVMRPAGSTLALPKEGCASMTKDESVSWHFAVDVMDYARVMKGTEDYMLAQFDEEIQQLEQLEKHDELMFGDDSEWTGKAIRTVREAKEKTRGIGNPPRSSNKPEEATAKKKTIAFHQTDDGVPEMYFLQHAAKSGQSLSTFAANVHGTASSHCAFQPDDSSNSSTTPGIANTSNPGASVLSTSLAQFRAQQHMSYAPSDYHFYQALLHYYLAPLDIRILRAAFGDFSSFPSTILPRVERVSTGHVIDDDLRKRAKYLAHLPHGCEVNFLECDWTDTVAPEILDNFKTEIERRRKKNYDKETREEKERARAEKEEDDKRYATTRRKQPSSPNEQFQSEAFQPLITSARAGTEGLVEVEMESTSPLWSSRKANGSSFAFLASPSTSPNASRTVWGTTVLPPISPVLQALPQQDLLSPEDGWLQGWEQELLQEDDLVAQVEATSLVGESSAAGASSAKKKKGKKITLMSTGVRRGA